MQFYGQQERLCLYVDMLFSITNTIARLVEEHKLKN